GPGHAARVRVVLGLLELGLEDRLRAAGGRAGAGAARVGVGGLDDREDVGLGAVAAVRPGLERALAALLLGQLVGVLVMAEADVQRHVVAVDPAVRRRAVLGVGDRDVERD